MKSLNYVCFIVVIFYSQYSSASRISLQVTPKNIYQPITKTLKLRCAVESYPDMFQRQSDIASDSNQLSARNAQSSYDSRDWWNIYTDSSYQPPTPTSYPTKQPPWGWTEMMTPTREQGSSAPQWWWTTPTWWDNPTSAEIEQEISHITSIVVTRRDAITGIQNEVARLSSFDPPTANDDFDNIRVDGAANTSPVSWEHGYLEITWDYPGSTQAGLYTCNIFALNTYLLPVSFSQSVLVSSYEPTISELASVIEQYDKIIKELQESVFNLSTQVSELNVQQTEAYNQIIKNITEIIQERTGNIKAQNIQTGLVTCDNDYVSFLKPYNKIPTILVVVSNSFHYQGSLGSMTVTVENLTERGFIPVCTISGLAKGEFSWIAIDN